MKKWIFLIIFLIVLAVAGVGFYILSLPPKITLSQEFKEKAVTKLLGRKAQLDAVAQKTGNTTYKGKYITFDYPAKAVIYTLKDPAFASSSSLLEDFSFDIKEPRLILNMAVLNNEGRLKSLDDNPGVRFRENSPGQYRGQNITVDGRVGRVYARKDENPEKTAFFLVNDKIYTISVTGTIFEEIESLSSTILDTAKFQNPD